MWGQRGVCELHVLGIVMAMITVVVVVVVVVVVMVLSGIALIRMVVVW